MQAQHDGELTIQAAASEEVLRDAMAAALDYVGSIDDRRVAADRRRARRAGRVRRALPRARDGRAATLRLLDEVGGPATMASTGARYFGFVIGATLPVALGSAWLAARGTRTPRCP